MALNCVGVRARNGLFAALLVAGGCGGGSGGGSPPLPPAPQVPVFTSAAAVSVRENAVDVVYRPIASDPNNDPITYTMTGADAASFTMNSVTREVRFAVNPDFEQPEDADHNNIYQLTFTASDGANVTTQAVAVTITDVSSSIRLRKVMGIEPQMKLIPYPDAPGKLVRVDPRGAMTVIDPTVANPVQDELINITSTAVVGPNDFPFLNAIFSQNFIVDRTLYVFALRQSTGTVEVWKYRMSTTTPNRIDPNSRDTIFSIAMPLTVNLGGLLATDRNGELIVGIGAGDDAMRAQEPNSLYGKILRIDPGTDAFPNDPDRDYSIPAGNPYAAGGGASEIFAVGVARPNDGRIDPRDGKLFFSDSGTFTGAGGPARMQEIHNGGVATSVRTNAPNHGWPLRVGGIANPDYPPTGVFFASEPEAAYDLATGGNVIVGMPYHGPIESFQNKYIFGDTVSQKLWSLNIAFMNGGGATGPAAYSEITLASLATEPLGAPQGIFTDSRGNLFIIFVIVTPTLVTGSLYVVEPDN